MQWDAGPNAGFSAAKVTWLPVAPGYAARNVASESSDPDSLLSFYRALIRLRKENSELRNGGFELIDDQDDDVLAYMRGAVLVALNFSAAPQARTYDRQGHATTLVSSFAKTGQRADLKNLVLPPYGAYVGQVE
jgi:alpha-glucosidase